LRAPAVSTTSSTFISPFRFDHLTSTSRGRAGSRRKTSRFACLRWSVHVPQSSSGDPRRRCHVSGSRALVISEVIHLQVRTQVRDNLPRCRASTLPPLHTASMSNLRGSPPTRGDQIPQELPRQPRRL